MYTLPISLLRDILGGAGRNALDHVLASSMN
jgi:hypothetical protein